MKKTTQGKKENAPEPRAISFEKHLYKVALDRLRDKSDPLISSQELNRRLGISDSPPHGCVQIKNIEEVAEKTYNNSRELFLKRDCETLKTNPQTG